MVKHWVQEVGVVGIEWILSSPVQTEDILARPGEVGPELEDQDDDLLVVVTGVVSQFVQQVHGKLLQILKFTAISGQTKQSLHLPTARKIMKYRKQKYRKQKALYIYKYQSINQYFISNKHFKFHNSKNSIQHHIQHE